MTVPSFDVPNLAGDPRIKQMSDDWIEPRVRDAVGGDQALADEILESYVSVLAKIDGDTGVVSFFKLDDAATEIGSFTP